MARSRWPHRLNARVNARLNRTLGIEINRIPPAERVSVRPPSNPELDRTVQEPVFLLSSVRSGSTLLRVILNSHAEIHAPHETHFRRLKVTPSTEPVRQAMTALGLNVRDLEHLLWDRVLGRELRRSGKSVLVEKTPSNVFVVNRLATAWPRARFIYLLRHPHSVAQSWHEGKPDDRPMSVAISHTLNFMEHVEKARDKHPGLTLRYENLTAQPEIEARRICDFLGVEWQDGMQDYGQYEHGEYVMGIGDWSEKIRSGKVQPGRPLPTSDQVPPALREMCKIWGY